MPSAPPTTLRVVIIGNDAFLAARPAQPLQLARACQRLGYDLVAPASWGEELLAVRVAEAALERGGHSVVIAHCPKVVDALSRHLPEGGVCVASVSPPIATARHVRAGLAGRDVRITYVGNCPGAQAEAGDVDEVETPSRFLSRLLEAGIDLEEQPPYLESQLPPERARHASMPGGAPDPAWLRGAAGAELCEAAPATLRAVLAEAMHRTLVVDLGDACGCACAGDRHALARIEPPRSPAPVVSAIAGLDLSSPPLEELLGLGRSREALHPRTSPSYGREAEHWSEPEAAPWPVVPSPESARTPRLESESHRLTQSRDPWAPAVASEARLRAPAVSARDPGERERAADVGDAASIEKAPPLGTAHGAGSAGSTMTPGVGLPRTRSRSPVPPVTSPALLGLMQELEAQRRHARRRAIRTWVMVFVFGLALASAVATQRTLRHRDESRSPAAASASPATGVTGIARTTAPAGNPEQRSGAPPGNGRTADSLEPGLVPVAPPGTPDHP